jgi:hypothetical protein
MMARAAGLCAWLAVGLAAGVALGEQVAPTGAAAAKVLTRAEAIQQTLEGIRQEVKDHGGSWEKWIESVNPYRDDIRNVTKEWQKYKWPWPARNGYVFQGAAVQVQLRDSFDGLPEGERPFDSISHFNKQLKALGIDLIVAFIPAKMSVYPDYMYAAVEGEPQRPARAPADRQVSLAVRRLMQQLLEDDVEVIDLHRAFADFRQKNGDDVPLFYVRDAHFINRGARLCAEKISERLKRYDFVQAALPSNPYVAEKGSRDDGDKADNDLLLIKTKDGKPQADDPASKILLLGDSHLYYNPANRALVSAQIAYRIGMPIAMTWKEGLSGEIPVVVAKDPQLAKRRVIVMLYTERMLAPRPGKSKWPIVALSGTGEAASAATAAAGSQITDVAATGVIVETCPPPDSKADYPHYLMKFYVKDLVDATGKPIGAGDGVVSVLAMHNRKVLPPAGLAPGQKLSARISSWQVVEGMYGKLQTGTLKTISLEIEKPLFWGEVDGQPKVTAEELKRVGESDSVNRSAAAMNAAQAAPVGAKEASAR